MERVVEDVGREETANVPINVRREHHGRSVFQSNRDDTGSELSAGFGCFASHGVSDMVDLAVSESKVLPSRYSQLSLGNPLFQQRQTM